MRLHNFAIGREQEDFDHSCQAKQSDQPTTEFAEKGMKAYWKQKNLRSQDGLPGLIVAYTSENLLGDWRRRGVAFRPDNESVSSTGPAGTAFLSAVGKVLAGFAAGVVVSSFVLRLRK